MKKLFAIALITSVAAGAALQAATQMSPGQPHRSDFGLQGVAVQPITDPQELEKQIKELISRIRKIERKRNQFVRDSRRAAKDGDLAQVKELYVKIAHKTAKLAQKRALLRTYTVQLAKIKSEQAGKERKPAKEKAKKIKTEKKHKEKKRKAKSEKGKEEKPYQE